VRESTFGAALDDSSVLFFYESGISRADFPRVKGAIAEKAVKIAVKFVTWEKFALSVFKKT